MLELCLPEFGLRGSVFAFFGSLLFSGRSERYTAGTRDNLSRLYSVYSDPRVSNDRAYRTGAGEKKEKR